MGGSAYPLRPPPPPPDRPYKPMTLKEHREKLDADHGIVRSARPQAVKSFQSLSNRVERERVDVKPSDTLKKVSSLCWKAGGWLLLVYILYGIATFGRG